MAIRAAAKAAASTALPPRGLRALFSSAYSSFPFNLPQPQTEQPPKADPSPNLFVSGLSKRTTSEGLRDAFAKFGEVAHARVVTDRVSGYSKGFGFVRYNTVEEAEAGIKGMDGKTDEEGRRFVEVSSTVPGWMGYFCGVCKTKTTSSATGQQ